MRHFGDRAADGRAQISIHASRMGCDIETAAAYVGISKFQSTHPVWDATEHRAAEGEVISLFQSTHPVWDAT